MTNMPSPAVAMGRCACGGCPTRLLVSSLPPVGQVGYGNGRQVAGLNGHAANVPSTASFGPCPYFNSHTGIEQHRHRGLLADVAQALGEIRLRRRLHEQHETIAGMDSQHVGEAE
jgi:hypothetical protein